MKVALVNQHYVDTTGGSEIQCDLLARGLQERGHDVVYVAPRKNTDREIIELPYKTVPVVREAHAISNVLCDIKPDIVYWRFNKHCFGKVAAKLHKSGIPILFAVSHINDITPWSAKPVRGLRSRILRLKKLIYSRWEHHGFKYVKELCANNKDYISFSPVKTAHYVPNGMVDKKVDFHWSRPFCVWVANIKPAKRPELFVKLAEELSDVGVDFLMVGNIQDASYRWLEDLESTPGNLHYLGPKTLEQVNGILAASVLHVHTCQPEGFSNVFIQAWMQGKPSVSLSVDPCHYIADQGLGCNANGDWQLFVDATRRFLSDEALRKSVEQKARAFAEQTFAVDAMVSRVEKILLDTVGRAK